MNLCIDLGNSCTKLGIFDNGKLVCDKLYKNFVKEDLSDLFQTYAIRHCILSSVIETDTSLVNYIKSCVKTFIWLDHTVKLPIENLYKTPNTLGNDRLAAAVGANFLYPNRNLLIIDIGSAITYDLVNAQNQYVGGNIAPGVKMRLNALHAYTQRLPLVNIKEHPDYGLIGQDTEEAIANGVMNGIIFEIEGYYKHLCRSHSNVLTFLTGGNLYYFHNRLKITTFVEIFLVLIGLNRILEYNVQD